MALPLSLSLCSILLLLAPPLILSHGSLEPREKLTSGSSNKYPYFSSKFLVLEASIFARDASFKFCIEYSFNILTLV
jgi:hypothetical protein